MPLGNTKLNETGLEAFPCLHRRRLHILRASLYFLIPLLKPGFRFLHCGLLQNDSACFSLKTKKVKTKLLVGCFFCSIKSAIVTNFSNFTVTRFNKMSLFFLHLKLEETFALFGFYFLRPKNRRANIDADRACCPIPGLRFASRDAK